MFSQIFTGRSQCAQLTSILKKRYNKKASAEKCTDWQLYKEAAKEEKEVIKEVVK